MTPSAPPQTKGFILNHTGLRISNLDRSIRFYRDAFGMKELYRLEFDTVTVAFMGHVDTTNKDDNNGGDGDAGGLGHVFAREGVLELVCPKDAEKASVRASEHAGSRFAKLCFSVPDIHKAMDHLASRDDVKIVKALGDTSTRALNVVAGFLGCADPEKGLDRNLWDAPVNVGFVEDPDGWLIEVIPY